MSKKYTFSATASVEHNVLAALETRRACASVWLRRDLAKLGLVLSAVQMSSALQRLCRAGLVRHEGAWSLCGDALDGSLFDPKLKAVNQKYIDALPLF